MPTRQSDSSIVFRWKKPVKFARALHGDSVHLTSRSFLLTFLLQEENIAKLCNGIVSKTEELCPSQFSKAREMSLKFKSLFQLFATCHFVYDSADHLDDENIDKLG